MKNDNVKFKKLIYGTFIGLLFLTGTMAFAQTTQQQYTVLSPLPGTTNVAGCNTPVTENSDGTTSGGCQADLAHYLPGLFNLLIGVGAVAAFVVITIYGLELMLTDSLATKLGAKTMLENALWGLGLIIFAWVILNTINPALIKGTLNITTPTVTTPVTATVGGNGPTGSPCAQCTASLVGNVPTKAGIGTFVTPKLSTDLISLNSKLANTGGIEVTEANPPTYTHTDPCHANGTCVDAVPATMTPANINAMYAAANQSGLSPSYEVQTQAQADALKASGVTIPIVINAQATGGHFHIKLQ